MNLNSGGSKDAGNGHTPPSPLRQSHPNFFNIDSAAKRANTGQDCMVSLVLLYIHKDVPLDYAKVTDKFASAHPRRMTLLNPLSD